MKQVTSNNKLIALYGLYIALAFIFSYIESLYTLGGGIPGVKIGLANLVVVVALYINNNKTALVVSVIRIILAGFMFGSMMSIIFSLIGGFTSLVVMILCKKSCWFSTKGVSIAGAVTHNTAQIITAVLLLETNGIIGYLPILLVVGVVTGIVIGTLGEIIIKRIKNICL